MASQSKRRRVRYDRILAVLLVLILLIVLLVKCCSSCSSKKDKKNDNVTTTPTQATTAPTEADNTKTVYLSPSNQEDNKFYVATPTKLRSAAFWHKRRLPFWNSPA